MHTCLYMRVFALGGQCVCIAWLCACHVHARVTACGVRECIHLCSCMHDLCVQIYVVCTCWCVHECVTCAFVSVPCAGACALVLSAWSVQGVASHPFPGEVRRRRYFSPLLTPWRVILPEQTYRPEAAWLYAFPLMCLRCNRQGSARPLPWPPPRC